MVQIKGGDTIPYGVYSGKRLRDVVKKYGRRVLLEIVEFNDVDDTYLKKYHYHHPATEEEKRNWNLKLQQMEMLQEETNVSASVGEEYVTNATEVIEEEYFDQVESMENASLEDAVLFDPEDDHGDPPSPFPEIWIQPYCEDVSDRIILL